MSSVKYKNFRKRLLLETGVIVAILTALGGGAWFLDSTNDDYKSQSTAMEADVNNINTQTRTLRDKFNQLHKDTDLYQQVLLKNSRNEFTINRRTIYEKFNQYKSRYYLNDLRLAMGAVADLKGAAYTRPTTIMVGSEITVDLSALSDEHIYNLLYNMQQELPGAVQYTKVTLTRSNTLSSEVLRQISEKGTSPLVKGNIKFTWLGIKPVEASDNTTNAPKH